MPVYNAVPFLRKAIESILSQTYEHFELIIINDASTDKSASIINEYKEKYPHKIKVISLTKNLNRGGDMCANLGIKKARGKYIARMDADDISHKERLSKQVAFLQNNKNVFLVGSNAYVINKKGRIIGKKNEPLTPYYIYKSYFTFHPLIHPVCTFRRIINGKPFSYKLEYGANNDYLTFFTLLCKGYIFVNLEDKLLYYRIHGNNDTFKNVKKKFLNTMKIRIQMVLHYGYRPSFKAVAISFIQAGIVFVLPEKILVTLYMLNKGILDRKKIISSLKPTISFSPKTINFYKKVTLVLR